MALKDDGQYGKIEDLLKKARGYADSLNKLSKDEAGIPVSEKLARDYNLLRTEAMKVRNCADWPPEVVIVEHFQLPSTGDVNYKDLEIFTRQILYLLT